jgi:hypothetical protein
VSEPMFVRELTNLRYVMVHMLGRGGRLARWSALFIYFIMISYSRYTDKNMLLYTNKETQ